MAKRKNKKRQPPAQDKAARKEAAASGQTPGEEATTSMPGQVSAFPLKQRKQVGLGTCLSGMFLTLLLGLYLGSLVPDLRATLQQQGRSAPATPAATGPAPVPVAAPTVAAPQTTVTAGLPAPGRSEGAGSKAAPVSPPVPEAPAPAVEAGSKFSIPSALASQIAQLEKKVATNPLDADSWTELGNAYFDTAQHASAIHAYEHSLEIRPDNPDVLTDLGIMYRETRDFEKALQCFRKASTINPHHVNALFNEGVVLNTDLGRKDEGLAAWSKILVFAPDARTPGGKPLADVIQEMR